MSDSSDIKNHLNEDDSGPDADLLTSEEVCTLIRSDGYLLHDVVQPVPREYCLSVFSAQSCIMNITCTPKDLKALIIGRLFTEGVISNLDDVVSVDVDVEAGRVDVDLVEGIEFRAGRRVFVPTYGLSGQAPDELPYVQASELGCVEPIAWNPDDIFRLAADFAADTPIHLATSGSHSCYLVAPDNRSFCCEDLGRHNALDKVIGQALISGTDITQCMVFSSGRIPVDMVSKVIRARIPIMVTKAVPTDISVDLARSAQLTLICSARPDSMKVFNDPMADKG